MDWTSLQRLRDEITQNQALAAQWIIDAVTVLQQCIAARTPINVAAKKFRNLVRIGQLHQAPQLKSLAHCFVVIADEGPHQQQSIYLITGQLIGQSANRVVLAVEIKISDFHVNIIWSRFFKAKHYSFYTDEKRMFESQCFPLSDHALQALYPEQRYRTVTLFTNPDTETYQWVLMDFIFGQPLDLYSQKVPDTDARKTVNILEIMLRLTFDLLKLNLNRIYFKDIKSHNALFKETRVCWIDCEGAQHEALRPNDNTASTTPIYTDPRFQHLRRRRSLSVTDVDEEVLATASLASSFSENDFFIKLFQNHPRIFGNKPYSIEDQQIFLTELGRLHENKKYRSEIYSLALLFLELLIPNFMVEHTGLYDIVVKQFKLTSHERITTILEFDDERKEKALAKLQELIRDEWMPKTSSDPFALTYSVLMPLIISMLDFEIVRRPSIVTVFQELAECYGQFFGLRQFPKDFKDFFEPLKPEHSGFFDQRITNVYADAFLY